MFYYWWKSPWLQMTRTFDRFGKKFTLYFAVKKGCYLYMDMLEMNKFGAPNIVCYLYTGVTYTRAITVGGCTSNTRV